MEDFSQKISFLLNCNPKNNATFFAYSQYLIWILLQTYCCNAIKLEEQKVKQLSKISDKLSSILTRVDKMTSKI